MLALENGALRLRIRRKAHDEFAFVTDVRHDDAWQPASRVGCCPLDRLIPTQAKPGSALFPTNARNSTRRLVRASTARGRPGCGCCSTGPGFWLPAA